MAPKKRRPLVKSRCNWIRPKQITLDDGLSLKKNIHVFPDVSFGTKAGTLEMILWFGKKNDGFGKRMEFPELLSPDDLKHLPKRNCLMDILGLSPGDWERYLEKKVLEILLPRLNLDIFFPANSASRNIVRFELGANGLNYIGTIEMPLEELSKVLSFEIIL